MLMVLNALKLLLSLIEPQYLAFRNGSIHRCKIMLKLLFFLAFGFFLNFILSFLILYPFFISLSSHLFIILTTINLEDIFWTQMLYIKFTNEPYIILFTYKFPDYKFQIFKAFPLQLRETMSNLPVHVN